MALVTKFYSILYPPPEIRIDTVSKIAKFESRYIFQTIICGIYVRFLGVYVFKGNSFGGESLDGHSHSRIVISCQEKLLSPKIMLQ